jgi:hypothetical protein
MSCSHPVNGACAFGSIPASSSGATFYIREADRINYSAVELIGKALNVSSGTTTPLQFTEGDRLWKSLEKNIASFVNAHGGSATVKPPLPIAPTGRQC